MNPGERLDAGEITLLRLSDLPQVEQGGSVLPLAARDAALLAWLAIEGPTSRERLGELLWPGRSEAQTRATLRQRLFQLKKRLGRDLAVGTPMLKLADGVVHDLNEAAELLGDMSFADAPALDAWLQRHRERLQRRERDELQSQAQALEEDGNAAAALPVALALLRLEPHSETAYQRVMRLHGKTGNRAAALQTFDACEQMLKHELSARPSPQTLALLAEIERAELAPQPAAPAGRPALRHDTDRSGTRFFGRDDELRELDRLWPAPSLPPAAGEPRLVSLLGPPGSGKTRLALHWAAQAGRRGATVALVRLDGLEGHAEARLPGSSEAHTLIQAIALACGVSISDGDAPPARLVAALQWPQRVVVLDNFEHRLADVPLLATLVAETPVRWLVSSRTRLGLACENPLWLAGLRAQAADHELPPAQQLVADRAGLTLPLAPATRARVDSLCQLAEGQPLALELAARQARRQGLDTVLQRLAQDPRSVAGAPDMLPHQRSLEAAYDSLSATLPAALRQALPRLALLRGDFDRELACSALGVSERTLEALADHSLLAFDARSSRFRWHPFLREFALLGLQRRPQAMRRLQLALAQQVAATTTALGAPGQPEDRALAAWVGREWPHVIDAWRTVLAQAHAAGWQPLAEAIATHCEQAGRCREGARLLAELDTVAPDDVNALAAAQVLLLRGRLAHWFDSAESLACALAAEPVFERAGARAGRIGCLRLRGLVHWRRGEAELGVDCQRQALAACSDAADARVRAVVLDGLGLSLLSLGRWAEASAAFEQALQINDAQGEGHQTVQNLINLSLDPRPERESAARVLAERALSLARELHYTQYVVHALTALAWAHLRLRQFEPARRLGLEAAAMAHADAERFVESWALGACARAALRGGDARTAAADALRALRAAQALGEVPPVLMHLSFAAEWALQAGDAAWALRITTLCAARPELNARVRLEVAIHEQRARAMLDDAAMAAITQDAATAAWQTAVQEAMGLWSAAEQPTG